MVKLISSSLAEVLISSLIVALSFIIGTVIYINIISDASEHPKSIAEAIIQEDLHALMSSKQFSNEKLKYDSSNISIERTVSVPPYSSKHVIINYKAMNEHSKLLLESCYLIKSIAE